MAAIPGTATADNHRPLRIPPDPQGFFSSATPRPPDSPRIDELKQPAPMIDAGDADRLRPSRTTDRKPEIK